MIRLNVRGSFRTKRGTRWARTVNKCETLEQAIFRACAWKPHLTWIERDGEPATKPEIRLG